MSAPRLTILLPVYNEAPALAPLYGEIARAAESTGLRWEALFVDDGSNDGSFDTLRQLHAKDPGHLRVLRLGGHRGKTAALAAGFAEARGEIIITMDSDGQDDPAEIPRFLEALEQGYGVVSGWKVERRDPGAKVAASRLFNWAVRRLTGVPLHDVNCGFKAWRAEVAKGLRLYGDMHRLLPVLAAAQGARIGEIPVHHRPRTQGRSKYGWGRAVRGFVDLLAVWAGADAAIPSWGVAMIGLAGLVLMGAGAVWALRAVADPSGWWAMQAWAYLLSALVAAGGAVFFAAGGLGLRHRRRSARAAPPPIAERLE